MKLLTIIIVFFTACGCWSQNSQVNSPEITIDELKELVNYLASDELEGRFTGSQGGEKALEYIIDNFESAELKSFEGSYKHYFPFISSVRMGGNNSFQIDGALKRKSEVKTDYIPLSFSGSGNYTGDIVFAGYGISAPELKYDDYSGIDIKGKAVLIMRYSPEWNNPHSKFEKFAPFRQKVNTAIEKGAAAVIFVTPHLPKDEEDKLQPLKYDGAPGVKDIPVIQIKRSTADELFEAAGKNFKEYQASIDSSLAPKPFSFGSIKLSLNTDVELVEEKSANAVGWIEGSHPELKKQFIVIGAHYDHLGYGQTGSLYRGDSVLIHNGADDNASGTAGLIELAEKFTASKDSLKRSIIFVAFSGEELGLLGSAHFVNNLPVPAEDIAAMINLDMIGRLNENKLIVYGTGTSPKFKEMLNDKNSSSFSLTFNDEGYGPSDHSSFYGKQIPVLFFFTGTHSDYHRPSDDAGKINYDGMESILSYVYSVASEIDNNDIRPEYVNVPRKDTGGMMAFKVYVGTIPDYSSSEGFRITGVSENSPAQKAGLVAGDKIVSFGGKKISNIYDYTYALGDFTPGETVEVIVERNGEPITLHVELGAR